jgi:type IV secretion system protein VirB5
VNFFLRFKKMVASVICGVGLSVAAVPAHAGIPVFDAGNFTDVIANLARWLQQLNDWRNQLLQMEAQLNQAKEMTSKLAGARNLGSILNNPLILSSLPPEMQDVASVLAVPNGISSNARATSDVLSRFGINVPATGLTKGMQLADIFLKNHSVMKSAQTRETQLTELATKVDGAADAKDSTDLVARNTIENARIMNALVQTLAMQELSRQQVQLKEIADAEAEHKRVKDKLAALPR